MTPTEKANATAMLDIFSAIERRDPQRLAELCHPDVEFCWPAAFPYGGTTRGFGTEPPAWIHTWAPLQPTEAERRMQPRVVASKGDEVVVLWRQRGLSPGGERFDGPVLALYKVRDGRLARAQMFYFDTPELVEFLGRAAGPPSSRAVVPPGSSILMEDVLTYTEGNYGACGGGMARGVPQRVLVAA